MMRRRIARPGTSRRVADLEARLAEAEETLRAIRGGEVDAIVVSTRSGDRVFTLEGADRPYRRLVEVMNEGAATVSPQGTIRYCNARFANLLGRPLEQVMGSAMRDHVDTGDRDRFDALARDGWEAGAARGELSLRRGDGGATRAYLAVSAIPEDDPVLCVVATDLTELASLEQAVAVRDQFISVASHEFKTPLTSLMLVVQSVDRAVRNNSDVPDAMRSKVAVLARQGRRLSELVANLLDVSRLQAGRLDLTFDAVDLCAVVREVADRYGADAAGAGCRLDLALAAPVVGSWDASRIDQVVSNLLANAIKYGAGKPVSVTATADGATAHLAVEDHGIGIGPENHERIFKRFERAVAPGDFAGMGLGLWIVREIVERLGGAVRVESRLGYGARFTVDLPLARPAANAAAGG
jgi:PAS domain S-box-containing protein